MIQIVETRLIIQRDNKSKDKYYPKIITATTSHEYPFSIPTATIEIVANAEESTSGYISPVRVDDIVRLQVSTKLNPKENTVWEDIFEGRVRDITSPYESGKNTATLFCVGHISEASTALIDCTCTYENDDISAALYNLCWVEPAFLSRITFDSTLLETGAIVNYYNIDPDQTYISDAFGYFEQVAKLKYYIDALCRYDSYGNLIHPYLVWRKFPEKVTGKYAVIEGSCRLLKAEFKSSAEELWNYIRVFGDKPFNETADTYSGEVTDNSVQYSGASYSATSITKYGKRSKTLSVTGIESNYMCANIATALVIRFRNPIVSGTATIMGTPKAHIGDLVRVKINSLEVNGKSIDRNYHVYKVEHSIDGNKYETTLDFTKAKKTPEDYIADFAKESKTNNSNTIESQGYSGNMGTNDDSYVDSGDVSDYGDSGYTNCSTYCDNTDYSQY